MNLIPLAQQEFGEVGPVLSRDAGYERSLHWLPDSAADGLASVSLNSSCTRKAANPWRHETDWTDQQPALYWLLLQLLAQRSAGAQGLSCAT